MQPTEASPAQVLVAGGSLGGLMTAAMLHRQGIDVRVLERSPVPLHGRGAGIVTHSRLVQALRACGVPIDDTLGVRVPGRVVLGPDGAVVARRDYDQVLTSWGRLYSLLLRAVPADRHLLGEAVTGVEQDADGVTVACANGRTHRASLLVAADGIRSGLRQALAPDAQPRYAGYVAWRGICDEASLSAFTLRTLFEHFGFGLPPHEQMLGYPVAGPNDATGIGQRCYNFVWYRPAPGPELRRLLTDADGTCHEGGIAPQKVHWRELAAVRQAAQDLLAPQFAEILQKTPQPFLQPIQDLESPALAFGRVALLGDAAFTARPHVGMGVTKAGEDAMALAQALARLGTTPAALAAYEASRLTAGADIVARGRELGAYLEGRHAGASRTPQKVMEETAIDLALQAEARSRLSGIRYMTG
ncbi:MAG: FAD-dependent oxidoreductase [Burkholderiaceae bacterium]|nr:FAD-dependent oxidoreductase [Burkholderiaceae bacterium]